MRLKSFLFALLCLVGFSVRCAEVSDSDSDSDEMRAERFTDLEGQAVVVPTVVLANGSHVDNTLSQTVSRHTTTTTAAATFTNIDRSGIEEKSRFDDSAGDEVATAAAISSDLYERLYVNLMVDLGVLPFPQNFAAPSHYASEEPHETRVIRQYNDSQQDLIRRLTIRDPNSLLGERFVSEAELQGRHEYQLRLLLHCYGFTVAGFVLALIIYLINLWS